MSLSQALTTAVSGLRAAQIGLALVSDNIANQGAPGYIRKTPVVTQNVTGGGSVDVINPELDHYIQRQLRGESSAASYAALRAQFYSRLQSIYGMPGPTTHLATD